ncbi:hypothetical protein QQF64_000050 [Cirrhinus molitorella]|uniref:Uncharacterized protein n=1 Tax=Cirrhinus molitorella TaxID=172907 RepID=A0ABR3NWS6_9TELE
MITGGAAASMPASFSSVRSGKNIGSKLPSTRSLLKVKGGSRCLVLIAVSLGLISVLLLVFIILQHITITAERDLIKSYKNTVEEFKEQLH